MRIGAYEVLSELGRGGAGVVYRARGPDGREVALKLLLAPTAERRVRFEREAAALADLQHPGIVPFVEVGVDGDRPFIVTALVSGESLQARLDRDGPLSPRAAARLVRAMAAALAHAHGRGVLHRDVKPANVLIDASGASLLADFGLARSVEGTNLTLTGELLGTPGYLSPEQARGDRALSPATDVFGLGATLYAALTGEPPFQGGSLAEVLIAVQAHAPPAPSVLVAGVDPRLDALCMRCLAPEPARRPSLAGVVQALDAYLARPRAGRRRSVLVLVLVLVLVFVLFARPAPTPPAVDVAAISSSAPPRPEPGPPAWFVALPADRRPSLPLPDGLRVGPIAGEFVNERDGQVLVFVPPGSFRMGSDEHPTRGPIHEVRFARGYYIGKYEVTMGQYHAFCRDTGRAVLPSTVDYPIAEEIVLEMRPDHPASGISWTDAVSYCTWAGLRLPSESEWEYAARGSDGRFHPWGDQEPGVTRGNFGRWTGAVDDEKDCRDGRDGFLFYSPVGSFPAGASPFGCLDMAGNISEWCSDWYAERYPDGPVTDPRGPDRGELRVQRDGCWNDDYQACRAVRRRRAPPSMVSATNGFRAARSVNDD